MLLHIIVKNAKDSLDSVTLKVGQHYQVAKGDEIKLINLADVKVLRSGKNAVVHFMKGEEFILENFYTDENANGQTLYWDDAMGQPNVLTSASVLNGTQYAANEKVVATDAVIGGSIASLVDIATETAITGFSSAADLSNISLARFFGLGTVGLAAVAFSGGESQTVPVTSVNSYTVSGTVTAGPVTAALFVTLFDNLGSVIGTQKLTDTNGNFSFIITNGYIGTLLAVVTDANGVAVDYNNEATGVVADLNIDLRGVGTANGTANVTIAVNPLTELAVRKMGVMDLAAPASATVTTISTAIANLFSIASLNSEVIAINDPDYATSTNSAAKIYGEVLALFSGMDFSGSMAATLTTLASGIVVNGVSAIFMADSAAINDLQTAATATPELVAVTSLIPLAKAITGGAVVNIAPVINSPATSVVVENSATSTVVYEAVVTDANVGDTITFSLSGVDDGAFTINTSTGTITLNASADFETQASYKINVVATDSGGLSATRLLTVDVIDVNEVPTFMSAQAVNFAEMATTEVYTATAADPEATTLTYSLTGSVDDSLFNITSGGVVTFKNAPDYEARLDVGADNVYAITVTVNDGINSADQAVAVTVTDVVEPVTLTIGNLGNSNVTENTAYTSATPTLTGTPVGAVTYSLSGTDATLFTVDAGTGVVSMIARNFEAPADAGVNNVYDYVLTATDADGNSDTQAVAVAVISVNEAPIVVNTIADATAVLNQPFNLQLTPGTFADNDAATTLIYTVSGMPTWMTFDETTLTFSGIPTDLVVTNVTVTSSDGSLSVSDTFAVSVFSSPPINLSAITVANVSNKVAIEASTLTYLVTLSSPSLTETVFEYSLGGATSTASASDFSAITSTSCTKGVKVSGNMLIVPAGVTYFEMKVLTIADLVIEETESLVLTVGGVSAKGLILDDDSSMLTGPVVTIDSSNINPLRVGETTTLLFALNQNSYATSATSVTEFAKKFTAGDVQVTGGSLSNFHGAGNFFEADFIPDGSTTIATVDIAGDVFLNTTGQGNVAATTLSLHIYNHAPFLTLGNGVINGATAIEATQVGGVVEVNGENGMAMDITFISSRATVTKNITGVGANQPVVLSVSEIATLGDGAITVMATPVVYSNQSVSTVFQLDTHSPNAPTTPVISESSDGITYAEAQNGTVVVVNLAGTTAVVGDTLCISWGTDIVYATLTPAAIVAGSSAVMISAEILLNGGASVNVSAMLVDAAGNASENSPVTVVAVDVGGAAPTSIVVHNAVELQAALNSANGGETILLATGDYGALNLSGFNGGYHYAAPVTLKSASDADVSQFATFSKLSFTSGTSNVVIDSVNIDYNLLPSATSVDEKAINIDGASKITIRNSVVDGDLVDAGDAAAGFGSGLGSVGTGAGYGFLVQRSSDVVLENNLAYNLHYGFAILESNHVTASGNEVHSVRTDMMELAGVQDAIIENNYFHDHQADWAVSWAEGDHRDMIQLWSTNTLQVTKNLTVRGNILDSGAGDLSQGIFMRNDEVDTNKRGVEWLYQNILIENNLIHTYHFHGITVGATDGLIIRNNTVLPNEDVNVGNLPTSGYGLPGIKIDSVAPENGHSINVVIANNIATSISTASITEIASNVNNLIVQNNSPAAINYVGDLFVDGEGGRSASLADLQALPDGVVEQNGQGANLTLFNDHPIALTSLFRTPRVVNGDVYKYFFDGSYSADTTGFLDITEANFIWNFGDGTIAQGINAVHEYQQFGSYDVSLTVVRDGFLDINYATVRINDPLLLSLDFGATEVVDNSGYMETIIVGAGYATQDGVRDLAFHSTGIKKVLTLDRRYIPQVFDLSQMSISLDFKADTTVTPTGKFAELYQSWDLGINAAHKVEFNFINATGASYKLIGSTVIEDTNWHQLTLSYDSLTQQAKVYLDGQLDVFGIITGASLSVGVQNLAIAGGANASFIGLIDDFELRSEALSADQALGRYQDMQLALVQSADRVLVGGSKGDNLIGGFGNDKLIGAGGNDFLTGGQGADQFIFNSMDDGVDTIIDFNVDSGDKIVLSSLLNGYSSLNINNYVFAIVGNGSTSILVDPNGSGDVSSAHVLAVLDKVSSVALDMIII